jgi:hypothetical protein
MVCGEGETGGPMFLRDVVAGVLGQQLFQAALRKKNTP